MSRRNKPKKNKRSRGEQQRTRAVQVQRKDSNPDHRSGPSKRSGTNATATNQARGSATGQWFLAPRDTLVLGDGRPVGDAGRRSLDMPWPSTLAGLVRTRIGMDPDGVWRLDRANSRALLDVPLQGPWLVRLGGDGQPAERSYPAPQDALWHRESDTLLRRTRLVPRPTPDDCVFDRALAGCEVVVPVQDLPDGKPTRGPVFWTEAVLLEWLLRPTPVALGEPASFGLTELVHETRTHVGLDPTTGTAEQGRLFATEGVRYETQRGERLAIGFRCEDPRIPQGACCLGGERRISQLEPGGTPWAFPEGFQAKNGRLRVVLLTPAVFEAGSMPDRIAGARVVAAAVGRPQVISGWDYALNKPKPSRRMVPAGSVYWVEPEQDPTKWAEDHWMHCVSDGEQDRRDGFGLCVVGVA